MPERAAPRSSAAGPRSTSAKLLVGEAPAALQHADAVALLGQPQRRDAAAEARPDDQPVEVELTGALFHLCADASRKVTGASRFGVAPATGQARHGIASAIGVCTALERAQWSVWDQRAALLPTNYLDAIRRAGGMALLLAPDPALVAAPDDAPDLIDGLVLIGGADIDPASYGAAYDPATVDPVPERDAFEIAVTRRAVERGMPLLGICRGMQLLNVALGGTLHQHLPERFGHHEHRKAPRLVRRRRPRRAPGARLARRARRRRGAARDEVAPPPGRRPRRRGPRRDRQRDARRAARGVGAAGHGASCSACSGTPSGRAQPRARRARGGGARASRRGGSRGGERLTPGPAQSSTAAHNRRPSPPRSDRARVLAARASRARARSRSRARAGRRPRARARRRRCSRRCSADAVEQARRGRPGGRRRA